jgi:GNAT superfamily N-acetyltransferase
MESNIRFAVAPDAPRLAELSEQLGYPTTAEEIAERLAQIQADEEQAVFVAETGDQIVVGWIHVFLAKLLIKDLSVEIGGLIIDEPYQGQGVGSLLLAQVEAWGKSQGATIITVRSSIQRDRAHDFYEKAGYQQVRTQQVFRKSLAK